MVYVFVGRVVETIIFVVAQVFECHKKSPRFRFFYIITQKVNICNVFANISIEYFDFL